MPERLIIEGCAIATVDDERREHADGHLVLEDGRIAAVGSGRAPAAGRRRRDARIDGRGLLATPGLVNCHHHLYQSATRGYAQQATLFEWLVALYPVWAHIDARRSTRPRAPALASLARSGCTTIDRPPLHLPARRRRPAGRRDRRGARDRAALPPVPWRDGPRRVATAACRPTTSSRTATRS